MTITLSAGGVLRRSNNGITEVLIVERDEPSGKWAPVLRQLPKGHVEFGEELPDAAIREVAEETGYSTLIIGDPDCASWQYIHSGQCITEIVYYFPMEVVALDGPPDGEFDRVRWIPWESAALLLSYPEEQSLLRLLIQRAHTGRINNNYWIMCEDDPRQNGVP